MVEVFNALLIFQVHLSLYFERTHILIKVSNFAARVCQVTTSAALVYVSALLVKDPGFAEGCDALSPFPTNVPGLL